MLTHFNLGANMPRIDLTLPHKSLDAASKSLLSQKLVEAAAQAEQVPNNPKNRMYTWINIAEADAGQLTCGGNDLTSQAMPCMLVAHFPAGVLNKDKRAEFISLAHNAFVQAFGEQEKRALMTSIILSEVADGHQGANGQVWELTDLAKAAGYEHLQHLVS
jgi:phenylpyruvate tautomerase PptA (4-oxalocrotonate tautomerase family)